MSSSGADAGVIHRSITSRYILRMSFIVWQMKEACCLFILHESNNWTREARAITLLPLNLTPVLCRDGELLWDSNHLISESHRKCSMMRGHTSGAKAKRQIVRPVNVLGVYFKRENLLPCGFLGIIRSFTAAQVHLFPSIVKKKTQNKPTSLPN